MAAGENFYWFVCIHSYCNIIVVGDLNIVDVKYGFSLQSSALLFPSFHYNSSSIYQKSEGRGF